MTLQSPVARPHPRLEPLGGVAAKTYDFVLSTSVGEFRVKVLTLRAISVNASYREKFFRNLCACSRYCEPARTACTELKSVPGRTPSLKD